MILDVECHNRRDAGTQPLREEALVNMGPENGVMLPQPRSPGVPDGGHAGADPALETPEGSGPQGHLDVGLLASRAVREEISVVSSHPACGNLLLQI